MNLTDYDYNDDCNNESGEMHTLERDKSRLDCIRNEEDLLYFTGKSRNVFYLLD